MDKIFVIVFHLFNGNMDDGTIFRWIAQPFSTKENCQYLIAEALRDYNRDKVIQKKFYVDCIEAKDLPAGVPAI